MAVERLVTGRATLNITPTGDINLKFDGDTPEEQMIINNTNRAYEYRIQAAALTGSSGITKRLIRNGSIVTSYDSGWLQYQLRVRH